MRFLLLFVLFVVSSHTTLGQVSNVKDLLLRMYNAESDEAFMNAFHDVQGISLETLNAENDSVRYLYHYCYAAGLEMIDGDRALKIQHIHKALQIRETTMGIFSSEYIELLWALGQEWENSNIDQAIATYESALIKGQYLYIQDKNDPTVRHWYGQCLMSLAHCYEVKQYHAQVVQAYWAAFSLQKDSYKEDDANAYMPMYLLSSYYSEQCHDYENSISVMAVTMQYIKEHEGENNKRYAECLYHIAANLGKQNKIDQAIESYKKAISILRICNLDYDEDMLLNYRNLFLSYIKLGNIDEAMKLRTIMEDCYRHNNQITDYYNLLIAAGKVVPKAKVQLDDKKILKQK